jgi:hypothetical protein
MFFIFFCILNNNRTWIKICCEQFDLIVLRKFSFIKIPVELISGIFCLFILNFFVLRFGTIVLYHLYVIFLFNLPVTIFYNKLDILYIPLFFPSYEIFGLLSHFSDLYFLFFLYSNFFYLFFKLFYLFIYLFIYFILFVSFLFILLLCCDDFF